MLPAKSYLPLATLLASGLLLSACGSNGTSEVKTTTPSSMLGTDSAATKVGGTPADTVNVAPPPTGASTSAPSTGQTPK